MHKKKLGPDDNDDGNKFKIHQHHPTYRQLCCDMGEQIEMPVVH